MNQSAEHGRSFSSSWRTTSGAYFAAVSETAFGSGATLLALEPDVGAGDHEPPGLEASGAG